MRAARPPRDGDGLRAAGGRRPSAIRRSRAGPEGSASTAREIIAQTLAEMTGRPVFEVLSHLDASPVGITDREFDAAESARLPAAFGREEAGLIEWLREGRGRTMESTRP